MGSSEGWSLDKNMDGSFMATDGQAGYMDTDTDSSWIEMRVGESVKYFQNWGLQPLPRREGEMMYLEFEDTGPGVKWSSQKE